MAKAAKPLLNPRKMPSQMRSERMVGHILEGAIRVLTVEGALRFTTARVAEVAGVSVGSLYQYFPNKQALLFRLQQEEWERTFRTLESVLDRSELDPQERFERAVKAFFRTEAEEAPLRRALDDAGAHFRDAPEAAAHREKLKARVGTFVAELAPALGTEERAFAAGFLTTVLAAVAEKVTSRTANAQTVERWAKACASMLAQHLSQQQLDAALSIGSE